MKKFTICMVSILMAIPLFAKTYSLQEAISNGSAEICKKIDGNINTVVIVDVQSDSESLSDYIYSELNYNFVNNLKKTSVAERNEFTLSLIKKEFEYQNSGEVSDMTIQSVGNSLGADCVVLGKIEDSSTGWKFTLKAVQVETKKILSVWSGTISKNDKDVKFIVSKDNVDNTVNKKIENYEEKRIIRTEVFFPYTSNPWSEEWEYIYYENDKGKFYDSNSYPEYWQEKLIKPKLISTYFVENDDLTELQYAAKILQDYGTVFVICRAENEIRYFQAVKLENSIIFQLNFSADGLKTVQNDNKVISVIDKKSNINDFILVEGGSFYMGSGRYRDNSIHKENVSSFYMCIHEVTQKEWFAYMTTLPTKYTKHLGDDYPIDCISINKAIEYCNKRSLAENLQPCYIKEGSLYFCDFKANGYRLPTESEWEYAAKGGKNKDTYVYSGSNSLGSVAWTNGPHKVMTKNSNSIGLFDMSGNVSELCWGKNQYYNTDNCNIRGGSVAPDGYEHVYDVSFSNDWPGGDGDGFNTFTGFRIIRNAN